MATTYEQSQVFMAKLAKDYANKFLAGANLWDTIRSEFRDVEYPLSSNPTVKSNVAYSISAAGVVTSINLTGFTNVAEIAAGVNTIVPNEISININELLSNENLYQVFLSEYVLRMNSNVQTTVASLYSGLTSNGALGTAGTALTEALVNTAISTIAATGFGTTNPVYFFVNKDAFTQADLNFLLNSPIAQRVKVIISQYVAKTGSAPQTMQNILFADGCLAGVMVKPPLRNDDSNIQVISKNAKCGFRLGLSFTGADSQVLTLAYKMAVGLARNSYGIVVRS